MNRLKSILLSLSVCFFINACSTFPQNSGKSGTESEKSDLEKEVEDQKSALDQQGKFNGTWKTKCAEDSKIQRIIEIKSEENKLQLKLSIINYDRCENNRLNQFDYIQEGRIGDVYEVDIGDIASSYEYTYTDNVNNIEIFSLIAVVSASEQKEKYKSVYSYSSGKDVLYLGTSSELCVEENRGDNGLSEENRHQSLDTHIFVKQ
ncbi:MAG: hypothetical protein AB8G05_14960 [Oligoflexales bacterium]